MAKAKTSDDPRMNMTKLNLLDQLQMAENRLEEEQARNADRQANLNLVRDQTTVQNAQEIDVKDIIKDFRVNLNDGLSGFEQQLYSSKEKLDEIQAAIKFEEQNLADVFEITKTSRTLQSLINATADHNVQSALTKKETREDWEKEILDHMDSLKERDELQTKQWNRKLEEARYDFELRVKKDKDQWEQTKLHRERELKETEQDCIMSLAKRKEAIENQENEIAKLKKSVENFDAVKQIEVDEAVKKALSSEKTSRHFHVSALEKEHMSVSKILDNDNNTLKALNERLTKDNRELKGQLDVAYGKIQETSIEVIKGAAQAKVIVNQESQKISNGK